MSSRFKPDAQTFKGFTFMGPESGGPSIVDSNDGKITRIRPYFYDKEYTDKYCNPWVIKARGSEFRAPDKVTITPFGLGYKARVYSKNRVRYPLKRVDWDPKGERNPQNRGKSGYVRISWDEAAQIAADELVRIKETYGPEAVLCQADLHGEGKTLAPSHGCPNRLLALMGGYTLQMRNMDSWEGWYWGAKHVWGGEPAGQMMPTTNVYPDIAEHAELLLYWGCDQETTPLGVVGQLPSLLTYWYTQIGLKSIYICPDLNYAAAVHADKWIPVLPNTDAALQLAIAYIWITEGTYEKEYLETHAYGVERFFDYVLGKEDGVPKTPEWASDKCSVPEWTIKALARDWAKKVASIIHGDGGSMVRGPFATEPARLEAMLLGMRALGSPGVHQTKLVEIGNWNADFAIPFQGEYAVGAPIISDMLRPVDGDLSPEVNMNRFNHLTPDQAARAPELIELFKRHSAPLQYIPRCLIHRAILEEKTEWYGLQGFLTGQVAGKNNYRPPQAEPQFELKQFPRPGLSRLHMIWSDSPCNTTCWNDGNLMIKAYQSPEIECYVVQHPWLENDCCFADLILPVATKHEMNDLCFDRSSGAFTSAYIERRSCPPVGESKTDFDVCAEVAKKLGPEYYDAYTGNISEEERVRLFYKASGIGDRMSWEEFNEKRILIVPCKKDALDIPPGLRKFYENPADNPLSTPTGLLEFTSTAIEKHMPDDPERPPIPKWVERSEIHDERLGGDRAREYPLLCMTNHGRWRMHAQCDDIIWNREVPTMKVRAKDGYQYEPAWLHPSEAEKRGIKHGDIIKVFNERGIVLCGAYVTERISPNVCYVDHGARVDAINPGELDRGGAINLITPTGLTGKNSTGMATSGFLVEVAKVADEEMEGWKREYPGAFARKIDYATGVCLDGWLLGS